MKTGRFIRLQQTDTGTVITESAAESWKDTNSDTRRNSLQNVKHRKQRGGHEESPPHEQRAVFISFLAILRNSAQGLKPSYCIGFSTGNKQERFVSIRADARLPLKKQREQHIHRQDI